jgi:adenine-specific DNA-methyltransferase
LSNKEFNLIKKLEFLVTQKKLVRIQEVFNVHQGIRTGNNSVFKLSKLILATFTPAEKQLFRPVIDNDAIDNGLITIQNYVWFPYSEEGFLVQSEEHLAEIAPTYYTNHLFPNKEKLINRPGKNESNWWLLSRHREWQVKKFPKLISTEFGKADSFAFDRSGEFVIERGNAWLPKKEFKHIDSNYFYLAFFSSSYFNTLLSIYSKELLSGWDLGKHFTKNIPIPTIVSDIINSGDYNQIVEIGKQIATGNQFYHSTLNEIFSKYGFSS